MSRVRKLKPTPPKSCDGCGVLFGETEAPWAWEPLCDCIECAHCRAIKQIEDIHASPDEGLPWCSDCLESAE